jgi:hypothetical protein
MWLDVSPCEAVGPVTAMPAEGGDGERASVDHEDRYTPAARPHPRSGGGSRRVATECRAPRRIEDSFGAPNAFAHLVGEKLLTVLEVAEADPEPPR